MAVFLGILVGFVLSWVALVLSVLGIAWRKRKLARAIKILVGLHLAIPAALIGCFWDLSPSVTSPLMSTSDKVAMQQSIRVASSGDTYRMAFTGVDLARGLRTVADALHVELHSEVRFPEDDAFAMRFALKHPLGYLNGSTQGKVRIEQGKVTSQLDRLWIGRLPVPSPVRLWIRDSVLSLIESKPAAKKAIATVVLGEIRDGQAHFEVLRQQNVAGNLLSRLIPTETSEEIMAAAEVATLWSRTQAATAQTSSRETGFAQGTKFVFDEAKSHRPTWTAVRQNRVALLAGGVILGHSQFARVASHAISAEDVARIDSNMGRITVQKRNDLVRHFWVSAAIATFSTSRISNLIGISKEEMDSAEGGSGFSFGDLLADRAGVRFAELSTRSEASAMEMQTRIASGWTNVDAIASVEGLPEGLSQAEFENTMGGTQGTGYRKWSDEVDQRVRGSKLLLPTRE